MMNNRIKELESKINQARHDYYNGQSKVSDKVYDAWIDELASLDPKNLAVIGIGAEPVSNWEKYTHKVPMGSLNKAQTNEEYQKWHEKYLSTKDKALLTLKLDGLSLSLVYENGIFTTGATRGGGVVGEKITPNVARMMGVPLRLSQKLDITVRGEILLSKENHQKHFNTYSNCRNAASGISRDFDGSRCDKLTVMSYQIVSNDLTFKSYEDQFIKLKELGFIVPPHYVVSSVEDIVKLKDKYQSSLRDAYEFDLDGLVVHLNDMQKHTDFGMHNQRPYSSIAIKFDSVAKEGYVQDIQIQVGNSGRLTPVSIFNPKINLMGAEVERASLHNFGNIRELGVGIGATVLVCRSGDVIPFIEEVVNPPAKIFEPPTHCPLCNTPVIENGEYVQCPNSQTCPAQVSGRIKNWVKELNILELGDGLIDKLCESGKVKTVADLYTLSVEEMSKMERMGKKSAFNVYSSLWSVNPIPLEVLLGALSIPLIGQSTIKLIMDAGHHTLDHFFALSVQEMEAVSGVGPGRAKSLYQGLKDNKEVIDQLLTNGLKIKDKVVGKLTGVSFCYTGTMVNKRAVLEKMAIEAGATVKNSVGRGLSYLVINEPSGSSKAVKAQELGTKLLTEDEFLEMVK